MTAAQAAADQRAEAATVAAGIHRLRIPTPFVVGRVNCYLIEDEPLTLVDTGPNSGKALDELERALGEHGRAVEDIELIVLTHQHIDHCGLLEILARRSGAEIAALDLLAPYLSSFPASAAEDDEFALELMRRHGMPHDLALALGSVGAAFRAFGSGGRVSHPLPDGSTLELRHRKLVVAHRPGHSPSDTTFWDEDRRILLAGDHLLAHISSNPLLSRPLTGGEVDAVAARPRALLDYVDSMQLTRQLPAALTLTGHGEAVTDHRALIDERLRMHARRARKVQSVLRDGPCTAFEIARRMWGNIAISQGYLTLCEVLGHLDLLQRDGRAEELDDGEVVRFMATDPPDLP